MRADLTRAMTAGETGCLGLPDGADDAALLHRLADEDVTRAIPLDAARPGAERLPADLRLANGESSYQSSGAQLDCTPTHLSTERLLLAAARTRAEDRKSTRLNSSHANISYAVFCLKKKKHR